MREIELRKKINKIIKENYINEAGFFSGLKSKISNLFSGNKQSNPNQKSTNVSYSPPPANTVHSYETIYPYDFANEKYIYFGNNRVPKNLVKYSLLKNVFQKGDDGKIYKKNKTFCSWLFSKKAVFEVTEHLDLSAEYDREKLKTTDIIFAGIWKGGVFKGYFEKGLFLRGFIDGGKYFGLSKSFLPGKPIKDKLNAFKSGYWASLDGLFGLQYLKTSEPVEGCHMLQLKNNSYIIFDTDKGIFKVTVLKQMHGNDFNFEYSVTKYNPSTKKYLKHKRVSGNLNDIQLNPELYNISKKNNVNLFFENNITIKSDLKVKI
jgi:hypothetical protein